MAPTTDSDPPATDLDSLTPATTPRTFDRHEGSWSANLEGPAHATDRDLVVAEALRAVDRTATGTHVNLVTHGDHGHPRSYLYDHLRERFSDVTVAFVDRCGCGGYVTRVHC